MARDECIKQLDCKKEVFIKCNLENYREFKDFSLKTISTSQSLPNNTSEIVLLEAGRLHD